MKHWDGIKSRFIIAWLIALGALAMSASLAQAHVEHTKVTEFSSVGGGPTGVVIDNSNEDIYVASNASSVVYKFNPAGEPIDGAGNPTGSPLVTGVFGHLNIAVDNASDISAHDLYVPDEASQSVKKFKPNGEFVCKLNENESACPGTAPAPFAGAPEAVAVDPTTGYVYVSDKGNNVIDIFSPSGEYVTQIAASNSQPLVSPRDLKVDSLGDVLVATEGAGVPFAVVEFKPSSEPATGTTTWEETLFNATENATAIAIDPANNVYIALANGVITEYNPAGTELTSFNGGGVGFGMTVNATTGNIYFSLLEAGVAIFNSFNAATVTTGAASAITHTGATVEGTVNPEGLTVAGCFFKYGAQTKPCNLSGAEIGTGNTPVTVSAELTGLEAGTRYPYQLVVEVEGHEDHGGEAEFEAIPLATITTEGPTSVQPEGATLNGALTPLVSGEVEYYIEYGKELSENQTPAGHFTGENTEHKIAESVTGLEPSTVYYYQLVAVVEGHIVRQGGPQTFETQPLATATIEAATNVAAETATFNGKVNVLAGTAGYYFEYIQIGQEEPYPRTEEKPLTLGEHTVTANATGLAPNRLYFVRIVVIPSSPSAAPIMSSFEAFTTQVGLPVLSNESASHQGRHSATVSGKVNPKNGQTTYYFEYANAQKHEETGGYNKETSRATISANEAGTIPLSVGPTGLSELEADTEYHYRLVATNEGGTTFGSDHTFSTTAPKPPLVETELSSQVTQTTATINATVNPNGLQTNYVLEVGTLVEGHILYTPSFGEVGGGNAGVGLAFTLNGLQAGTTYYYRIVAQNEDGTTPGADLTFTTAGFPAVITAPPTPQIIPTPVEGTPKPPVPKETRAQKYAKAVKLCHKKPKKKRAGCLRKAKKQFGPTTTRSKR